MVYVAAGINNGQFVPTGEYKTTRVEVMGASDVPQDWAPAANALSGASSKVSLEMKEQKLKSMPLYNEALCGSAGKSKCCWPLS